MKHDFRMNSQAEKRRVPASRVGILMLVCLLLMFFLFISQILEFASILDRAGLGALTAAGWMKFFYLFIINAILMIALARVALNDACFPRTFPACIRLVGILLCVGAFLLPRLPGYDGSVFEILRFNDFVLSDGFLLLGGCLLLVLGNLIHSGFEMETELNEEIL